MVSLSLSLTPISHQHCSTYYSIFFGSHKPLPTSMSASGIGPLSRPFPNKLLLSYRLLLLKVFGFPYIKVRPPIPNYAYCRFFPSGKSASFNHLFVRPPVRTWPNFPRYHAWQRFHFQRWFGHMSSNSSQCFTLLYMLHMPEIVRYRTGFQAGYLPSDRYSLSDECEIRFQFYINLISKKN